MKKLTIILPCLILMFQYINAKVEKPNFDFDLESLNNFFPDKEVASLAGTFGEAEKIHDKREKLTSKFQVKKNNYQFSVLVQSKDGRITDFFARLPSYFLHDTFFQSLVNRYGKQKTYKRVEEEAFYVWENEGLKHIYSASCTITCFPVFYSVQKINAKGTLLDQMKTGDKK